jgi:hypothetical protein
MFLEGCPLEHQEEEEGARGVCIIKLRGTGSCSEIPPMGLLARHLPDYGHVLCISSSMMKPSRASWSVFHALGLAVRTGQISALYLKTSNVGDCDSFWCGAATSTSTSNHPLARTGGQGGAYQGGGGGLLHLGISSLPSRPVLERCTAALSHLRNFWVVGGVRIAEGDALWLGGGRHLPLRSLGLDRGGDLTVPWMKTLEQEPLHDWTHLQQLSLTFTNPDIKNAFMHYLSESRLPSLSELSVSIMDGTRTLCDTTDQGNILRGCPSLRRFRCKNADEINRPGHAAFVKAAGTLRFFERFDSTQGLSCCPGASMDWRDFSQLQSLPALTMERSVHGVVTRTDIADAFLSFYASMAQHVKSFPGYTLVFCCGRLSGGLYPELTTPEEYRDMDRRWLEWCKDQGEGFKRAFRKCMCRLEIVCNLSGTWQPGQY